MLTKRAALSKLLGKNMWGRVCCYDIAWNHLANMNQTCQEWSLDIPHSEKYMICLNSNQDGQLLKTVNSKID